MTFTSRWTAGGAALLVVAARRGRLRDAPAVDYDKVALDMIKASFRAQGRPRSTACSRTRRSASARARRRRRRPT